jgi:toxin HigB-1
MIRTFVDKDTEALANGERVCRWINIESVARRIRINDQYRVCFIWMDGDAYNVEVCDYH